MSKPKETGRTRARKNAEAPRASGEGEGGGGFEEIGAKRIPFSRSRGGGDYVVTTYGSADATDHARGVSLLTKHKRRGKVSWGTVVNGDVTTRGATRRLQRLKKTALGSWLIASAEHLMLFPEAWPKDNQYSPGRIVRDVVREAIATGDTSLLRDLAKAVEGVHERRGKETKGGRICER